MASLGRDELFAIDEERADEEAKHLAARIIADENPCAEFRRILGETQSVTYARIIAERAGAHVVQLAMSENFTISVVPVPARRLADFLHHARLEIAIFG